MTKRTLPDGEQEQLDRRANELAAVRDRAVLILERLGATVTLVHYSLLRVYAIRGRRQCCQECVLARLLSRQIVGYRFEVFPIAGKVHVYRGGELLGDFQLGKALSTFAIEFDDGKFPELDCDQPGTLRPGGYVATV